MKSIPLLLAVGIVRAWTWLYTWRLPPALRQARLAEIESDLWECRSDAAGKHPTSTALHLVLRLLLGIPDDLGWRFERAAAAGTLTPRTLELAGRAMGAAVFIFILALMDADAGRRRSTDVITQPVSVSGEQIETTGGIMPAGRRIPMLTAGIAATFGVLILPQVDAQSPSPSSESPAFEVASVRKTVSSDARTMLAPQPGGRLTGVNVTAAMLIRFAYDLPHFHVSGGPDWLDSERFDVHAKAEGDPPTERKRQMLRRLLAERFNLTAHIETRELPIYALVMVNKDGRLGPQLRRSAADCSRADNQGPQGGIALGPKAGPMCGFFGFSPKSEFASGRAGLAFRGLDMASLAKRFVPILERSVIDRTGLTGYFDGDFDLIAELPVPPPPPGAPNPFDAPFASIFAVLPQQLGLKLDAAKGAVNVLVIDSVERPAVE